MNAYLNYAKSKLPTGSSKLDNAVRAYLDFRLSKNPPITVKAWEVVIDEVVAGLHLEQPAVASGRGKSQGTRKRVINANKDASQVDELIYLFQVATIRKWNHVYFTPSQDAMWNNMSYYQDPYWNKLINDNSSRKLLREVLDGEPG